ncbi:MAG: FAD-binding oxidoreductase [Acidobacteriota bacterium]
MISRREFLKTSSLAAASLPLAGCVARPLPVTSPYASAIPAVPADLIVNDVHSQLNATRVDSIVKPATADALQSAIARARAAGLPVSVAGGRHAMGGQQFGEAAMLVDTRALAAPLAFDDARGLVTVEAGIQWPALLDYLARQGEGRWGIVQKQTGADRLSIGGALACNAHGRGLSLGPLIQQVEWFEIASPDGEIRRCSRTEHADLFGLAIGGYGLFGIITRVQLRLRPRVKVRRVVELRETADIMDRFEQRIRDGYLYGDFQFATDSSRDSFLARGVLSCYQPVAAETPLTLNPTRFHPEDWARLTFYSHKYKRRAFETYSSRYLQTSGQVYWHDWQLSAAYVDNYHVDLDRALKARVSATEMITELYVPRPALASFMNEAARALRRRRANLIYGTVRLIEKDDESVLAWARERWACVVLNLHVEHAPAAIDAAADAFRDLIDVAIGHGGSYYLTYHRWARKDQVEACYPRMREFLELKRRHDPEEVFQSTWYRHYRRMFQS